VDIAARMVKYMLVLKPSVSISLGVLSILIRKKLYCAASKHAGAVQIARFFRLASLNVSNWEAAVIPAKARHCSIAGPKTHAGVVLTARYFRPLRRNVLNQEAAVSPLMIWQLNIVVS
jgi:hypothetical protein